MNILIACEYSGTVRDAFLKKGHNAVSCDILPSESSLGIHYTGPVEDILYEGWDMLIAHPPCTYLTITGNKWFYHPDDKHLPTEKRRSHPRFPERKKQRENAVEFFMKMIGSGIPKIAVENPIGHMSTRYRKPNQIIQPYQFGHPVSKQTCLWLNGLPLLEPTNIVEPEWVVHKNGNRMSKWHYEASLLPIKERSKIRSKTFQGIADAMADQWG